MFLGCTPVSTLGFCAAPLVFLGLHPMSIYGASRVYLGCPPCAFRVHAHLNVRVLRRHAAAADIHRAAAEIQRAGAGIHRALAGI